MTKKGKETIHQHEKIILNTALNGFVIEVVLVLPKSIWVILVVGVIKIWPTILAAFVVDDPLPVGCKTTAVVCFGFLL